MSRSSSSQLGFWSFFAPTRRRSVTRTRQTLDPGLGSAVFFFSGASISPMLPFQVKIHYKPGKQVRIFHSPTALRGRVRRETTGMHWHERHTEYLRVERGRLTVWLDGKVLDIGPDDGDLKISPCVVHQYRPADSNGPHDEVIVWERTDRESLHPSHHCGVTCLIPAEERQRMTARKRSSSGSFSVS